MNVSCHCYNERETDRQRDRETERQREKDHCSMETSRSSQAGLMEVGLHDIIHRPLGVYHIESVLGLYHDSTLIN